MTESEGRESEGNDEPGGSEPKQGRRLRALGIPGLGTAITGTVLLMASFTLPALVAVRSLSRMEEIRDIAQRTEALATIQSRLQQRIVDEGSVSLLANAVIVDAMRSALAELAASGLVESGEGERLEALRAVVARRSVLPPEVLLEGTLLMQQVAERETAREAQLLRQLRSDAAREVRLAAWGFVTVGLLAALFFWRRVLRPLKGLDSLLSRLRAGRFEEASTEGLHPFMLPVFENFNRLVERLTELEAAHEARAQSLEEAVRTASTAVIEQQQALARSERLAAVGETAAGVAHELRNPLAGAALALENLRKEVEQPELSSRLAAVSGEVDRAVRNLNDYLRSARHEPEPASETDVGELVTELAGLLRFQTPEGVTLRAEAEPGLSATLPRERLRQALTNLVLNAFAAMSAAGGGGEVVIAATHGSGRLLVSVEDEGPGFPDAVLQSGGRPFATSREGGTGLGLAIARRAARDLGGTLELYNREAGGAGARIELPLIHA
ncbi:MAG: ATP-binding protein [Gemmatimonadota bacterium]